MKLLFVLLLAAVIHFVHSQCDATYAKNLVQQYDQFVANVDTLPKEQVDVKALQLSVAMLPCFLTIGSFIAKTEKATFSVRTAECAKEVNNTVGSDYLKDPCCNVALLTDQCCAPRILDIKRDVPTAFTSVAMNNCKHPDQVKQLLRRYQRIQLTTQATCQSFFQTKIQEFVDLIEKYVQCAQNLNANTLNCGSDADCESGSCDPTTSLCRGIGLELTPTAAKSFGNCMLKEATAYLVRGLASSLAIKGQVLPDDFAQKLKEQIVGNKCVDGFGLPQSQYTSASTCTAVTKCTDGSNTCANTNSFCGAFCTPANGICGINLSALLPFANFNQATCQDTGNCYANGAKVTINSKEYVTRTECESASYCQGEANSCTDCETNEASCTASGRCLGFPGTYESNQRGICLIKKTGLLCPLLYTYDVGFDACIRAVPGASSCVSGASYIQQPSTKAECEQYTYCKEGFGRLTRKTGSTCTDCSGTLNPRFKWIPAKFIKRQFVPIGTWTQRKVVAANRWVDTIDLEKYAQFVQRAIQAQQIPLIKSMYNCNFGPLVDLVRTIACDCDAKSTDQTCFETRAPVDIGALIAYSGVKERYQLVGVSIETGENSIAATADGQQVTVKVTSAPIDSAATINTRSALATAAYTKVDVKDKSVVVGQLVGDGYSLSANTADYVTLCINVNREIPVDTRYKTPAFAVKSGNDYMGTPIGCSYDDAVGQICGKVKDTQTYYPAFVDGPIKGSAARVIPAAASLILLLVAFVFML